MKNNNHPLPLIAKSLFAVAFAGLLSFLPAPLLATTGTAVSRSAFSNNGTIASNSFNTPFTLGMSPTTAYSNFAVTQSAQASLGFAQLLHSAQVSSSPNNVYTTGTARAGWIDSFTITGSSGQGYFLGSVIVNLSYSGSGSVGNSATDDFAAGVYSDLSYSSTYVSTGFVGSVGNGVSYNGQVLNFTIPFTFGVPFDVAVQMLSSIQLGSNADYSLSHTASIAWGGATAIQDSSFTNLNPGSYTFSSTSGTDYIAPVPEPSSLLLAVAGAVIAGAARRRRRA